MAKDIIARCFTNIRFDIETCVNSFQLARNIASPACTSADVLVLQPVVNCATELTNRLPFSAVMCVVGVAREKTFKDGVLIIDANTPSVP
eukprot:6214390-Pleurochrysis_carterae.AAC.1